MEVEVLLRWLAGFGAKAVTATYALRAKAGILHSNVTRRLVKASPSSPRMPRRPSQLPKRPALSTEQIEAARYVGSPEHKAKKWWGGLPKAFVDSNGVATRPDKEDTTICTLNTEADRDKATKWVQNALKAGQFRFYEGDKDYPKKIWYRDICSGQLWFGQCVNSVQGEYKGWPTDEEERCEVFG